MIPPSLSILAALCIMWGVYRMVRGVASPPCAAPLVVFLLFGVLPMVMGLKLLALRHAWRAVALSWLGVQLLWQPSPRSLFSDRRPGGRD